MISSNRLLAIFIACFAITACGATKYLKGGVYKDLDENLTIVGLTENPNKYLDKDIVVLSAVLQERGPSLSVRRKLHKLHNSRSRQLHNTE